MVCRNKLTLLQNYVKWSISQSMNEIQICLFLVLDYISLREGNQEWHFLHLQRDHILHHGVSSQA